MTVSFPGSDVLTAAAAASSVAGFGALGIDGSGSQLQSSSPSASSLGTPVQSNPYQQAYDSLSTWSSTYLLQAIEYGAPQIPQYTAGGSASSFAQLTNLLAQIQPGLANGLYGGGTGVNALA